MTRREEGNWAKKAQEEEKNASDFYNDSATFNSEIDEGGKKESMRNMKEPGEKDAHWYI